MEMVVVLMFCFFVAICFIMLLHDLIETKKTNRLNEKYIAALKKEVDSYERYVVALKNKIDILESYINQLEEENEENW